MNIIKQKRRERALSLLITIAVSITLLFLYVFSFKAVSAPYLTMRSTPDGSVQVTHLIPRNHYYATIDTRENWTYVFSNGQLGWVYTSDISQTSVTPNNHTIAVYPIDDTVTTYASPRSTEKELGKLDKNTIYYVYYEKNNWSQIVSNNQIVWVQSDKLIKQ